MTIGSNLQPWMVSTFLQILCLQEVEEEHFTSWFLPQLHHHGMLTFMQRGTLLDALYL